ncbi:MAG: DUF1294 domain-containing protein [Saccharofermentans sp.]|nr:DUF1294 domain-containing protein [Saccharofermentans sp.]
MKLVIAIYLVLINIITFITYGMDKRLAIKHKWRISEATLILLAAIGGSIGAFLGMQVFRHKTKHMKFVIGVPVIFILQIILALFILKS